MKTILRKYINNKYGFICAQMTRSKPKYNPNNNWLSIGCIVEKDFSGDQSHCVNRFFNGIVSHAFVFCCVI